MASIESLKKQKAYAWAKYFESLTAAHERQLVHYDRISNVRDNEQLPLCLIAEIQEMMTQLKKDVACPVCYEVMGQSAPNQLKITFCGHKLCAVCYEKVNKCPMCRKTYTNKASTR